VPTLREGQRVAGVYSSKVAMLRDKFFPITSADLSAIESQVNQAPFVIEQTTTIEEITTTLASCSASSTPGDDEIPFSFLRCRKLIKIKSLLISSLLDYKILRQLEVEGEQYALHMSLTYLLRAIPNVERPV
jgi:hypothetical protein